MDDLSYSHVLAEKTNAVKIIPIKVILTREVNQIVNGLCLVS